MLLLVARVGRLLLAAEEGKQQQQQEEEEEKEEGKGGTTLQHGKAICVTCTAAKSSRLAAPKLLLPTISCQHPTAQYAPTPYSYTNRLATPKSYMSCFMKDILQ